MPWSPAPILSSGSSEPVTPALVRDVHALGDVRRLAVHRDDHANRVAVEVELAVVVADLVNNPPRDGRVVNRRRGGDLAGDHDQAGGEQRLASDARVRVLREAASRTASEIWSAILSGWPSVTDSEVKRNPLSDIVVS